MIRFSILILTFLVLDFLWLGFIAKKMYIDSIGPILRMSQGVMQPNWGAAVVVYIALVVGLMVFVIPKASDNALMALVWGGLFGLVVYATYDFTCMAVLSTWSLKMSIIDSLWGMVICGLSSFMAIYIHHLIAK